ncbi:uncharacterized protein LOC123542926 [Mercenaria mercenaria]|uniref:uncharacterized protein LOC123542926 n=1 Tax=Mercenaria mercenaria TaxID=6596 RepID=UPI00234E9AEE|nr:uncharacterized protein LOC123542926 [Mercenaria mercenaria]
MAVSWKSDVDVIFVQSAVKCFEIYPTVDSKEVGKYEAAFEFDLDNVPEGYTKLLLKHFRCSTKYADLRSRIQESLTDKGYLKNGERLIAAVEYGGKGVKREGYLSKTYMHDKVTGPAQPFRFKINPALDMEISVDHVQAFPCEYPSALDDWLKQERQNTWPSSDVLKEVQKTDLLVVSVGLSGSKDENLQRRISLTLAERALIRSFNDTQIKVYAAMKMLAKHELKPICTNITSYIVKNVIFWVFEKRMGTFQEDDFVEILLQALVYLKECITLGCLPNYMIHSKNLLQGKVSQEEKIKLEKHLDILITEDSTVLLRCPLVQEMVEKSEDELKNKLLFRELTDKVLLAIFAVPQHEYDKIEHLFHVAQKSDECVKVYADKVLPIIRESNPFGVFTLLTTLSGPEIIGRIYEGFMHGFAECWMG